MLMNILVIFVSVSLGGAVCYVMGVKTGKHQSTQALVRYERSMRETHGNQPTPATVLELPGLQAAIRYLLSVR